MAGSGQHTEYGDRDLALGGEILRTVVGSGVHGIAIDGTDDHDEMGVFVESPEHVVGIGKPFDHYVFRTRPEGARSGPGDTDLVVYSLRKYLRLAVKGNPTALLPLYASHALRLAYQGLEVARDARLTLPMPERERVLQVKRGDVPAVADVLAEIAGLKCQIEELLDTGRASTPPCPPACCPAKTSGRRSPTTSAHSPAPARDSLNTSALPP